VSNNFVILILYYISVSTQMQWENAMWLGRPCWLCGLRCKCEAFFFLGSRVQTSTTALLLFFLCVLLCCVFVGLCDDLFTRSEKSYSVCLFLTVCYLGTSTVTLAFSLEAAPQKVRKIIFTYTVYVLFNRALWYKHIIRKKFTPFSLLM
jgi:hypothetical protein